MLPLRATAHTELAYVHDYVENQMTISKRDMDQKVLKIPKIPSLLEEKKKISCLDQTFQLLWNSPG